MLSSSVNRAAGPKGLFYSVAHSTTVEVVEMTRRNSYEPYVYIPGSTVLSKEYKSLTPHTRQLYSYLILRWGGKEEWFSYSYKEIHDDSGYADMTIARGIRALAEVGFIEYKHGGLELNHNMYRLEQSWLNSK